MAKGDKVIREYYGRRADGVDLYRYAVPNIRIEPKPFGELISSDEEKYWEKPHFEILQDQTEITYGSAIDVESSNFTYTETDIEIQNEPEVPIDEYSK